MFQLSFFDEDGTPIRDVILEEPVTVGRHPDNVVSLHSPHISGRHVTFLVDVKDGQPTVLLRDEGSINSCMVNGQAVKSETVPIFVGDVIRFGPFRVELTESKELSLLHTSQETQTHIVLETSPETDSALLKRADQRLNALYRFASGQFSQDATSLAEATTRTIAKSMPFDVLGVILRKDHGPEVASIHTPDGPRSPSQVHLSQSVIERCFNNNVAVLANDKESMEEVKSALPPSLRSVICTPLRVRKENIGVLYLSLSSADTYYDEEALRFVELVASIVANNLATMRAFQELKTANEELELKVDERTGQLQTALESLEAQNRELRKAKEAAELASHAKSTFVANMSHEIRTPLNGVIGMLKLLLRKPLAPTQHQYARIAASSADSLLQVVNEVLDFSKIEAGKMELTTSPFPVRRVIDDVLAALHGNAVEKGIRLVQSVDPDVPEWMCGDGNKVRQVLMNLVNNAVKFTEEGEVLVRVNVTDQSETEVICHFEVNDTGVGMPEDCLDKLFRSFYQIDASTMRLSRGTGLGLAICKCFVEMMGGEVGVTSEVGRGSSFWFALSFEKTKAPRETAPSPTRSTVASDEESGSIQRHREPANLLLVEDHEVNEQIAVEFLREAGYLCDTARSGTEAIEAVKKKAYDLVLMDCQMPGMDGFEATCEIRQLEEKGCLPANQESRLPIVAVTASALKSDREHCLEVGMDDYLSKPLDIGQLIATVERHLPPSKRDAAADSEELEHSATESKKGKTLHFTPAAGTSKGPFAIEELLDRCMGNVGSVRKLLGIFERKIVGSVEQLAEAIDEGDAERVAIVAHALKGGAANMAAHALRDFSARLESLGRNRDLSSAPACLENVRAERDRCLAAIPELQAQLDGQSGSPRNEESKVTV